MALPDAADIVIAGQYELLGESGLISVSAKGEADQPIVVSLSARVVNRSALPESLAALGRRLEVAVAIATGSGMGTADVPYPEITALPPSYQAYANYQDGIARFDDADWEGALRLFKSAAGADSAFSKALILAARAYYGAGQLDEAARLVAALKHRPLLPYDRTYLETVASRFDGDMAGYFHSAMDLLRMAPGSEFAVATAVASAYRSGQLRLADSLIRSVPLPDRLGDVGYANYTYHSLGDYKTRSSISKKCARSSQRPA